MTRKLLSIRERARDATDKREQWLYTVEMQAACKIRDRYIYGELGDRWRFHRRGFMRSLGSLRVRRAMLMSIEGKSFFCLATGIQEVFHVSRRVELGRCITRRRSCTVITFASVNRLLGSIEVAESVIASPLKSLRIPANRGNSYPRYIAIHSSPGRPFISTRRPVYEIVHARNRQRRALRRLSRVVVFPLLFFPFTVLFCFLRKVLQNCMEFRRPAWLIRNEMQRCIRF